MMASEAPDLAAMMAAAEREWQDNAPDDWTTINFWHWPRGFHRSAWVVAGYSGWNPLDALDAPTPAARAVNALLTRQCVIFTIVMTRHTPTPVIPSSRCWPGSTPPCRSISTISPAWLKPSAMSIGGCRPLGDGRRADSSKCGSAAVPSRSATCPAP